MINKKNHIYGLLNNLVNLIAPIAVLPFVINHTGINNYGTFVQVNIIYALTTAVLFTSLTGYFIKEFVTNEKQIGIIFLLQMIFALVSGIAFLFYLLITKTYSDSFIFLLAIISNSVNFEWFFHAKGMQKELFFRTLIIRILFLSAVFLIIPIYQSIHIYIVIYSLVIILANILTFIVVIKKITLHTLLSSISDARNLKKIRTIIWDAKYFMLTPAVGSIYQYGDQILVSFLFGNAQLVFVNLAKQIIGASVMVSGTLCRVEQKNIIAVNGNERLKRIKKTFSYYSLYLLTCFIGINSILPIMLNFLIADTKSLAFWYYILISFVFVITSVSIFIDYLIGVSYRREFLTLKSNIICAIIVTSLNLTFLKHFGAYFSLFSLTIGEAIVVTLLLFFHRKAFGREKII
ncbi:hypothetical protein AB1E22_16995 [Buttiauxella gaviniae]|uniref:Putative O-antigen transporter n=1 Tax=Buttiauxella gaviniae TaxID=82990 RepID=A0ABV3NXV3_9ENTR